MTYQRNENNIGDYLGRYNDVNISTRQQYLMMDIQVMNYQIEDKIGTLKFKHDNVKYNN